jgi:diguanylate cyclase (GGDEF)-like protein
VSDDGLEPGSRARQGRDGWADGLEDQIRIELPAQLQPDAIPHAADDSVLSGIDQTTADSDQTLSDSDQTSSDSDQTSADSDQIAADRDQAVSDRDLASGLDPHEHQVTREIRERNRERRVISARVRLEAASARDAVSRARDLAALARDRAAAVRDQAMAQTELIGNDGDGGAEPGTDAFMRAAEQRQRAAEYRALAARHRAMAAADRRAAADDREHAAAERLQALADRETLAAELSAAETDALTGARTRAAGMADLTRELDRCHRNGTLMVVAYVDLVGLKRLNDTLGHAAGDELLRCVAELFRSRLRPYDLVVRVGGDEFVCAIADMSEEDVRERFRAIGAQLSDSGDGRGMRAGFATAREGESATELIARADAELIRVRDA